MSDCVGCPYRSSKCKVNEKLKEPTSDDLLEIKNEMHKKLCSICTDIDESCLFERCELYKEMLCYVFDERELIRPQQVKY